MDATVTQQEHSPDSFPADGWHNGAAGAQSKEHSPDSCPADGRQQRSRSLRRSIDVSLCVIHFQRSRSRPYRHRSHGRRSQHCWTTSPQAAMRRQETLEAPLLIAHA
mmetsp:Transcript_36584/g.85132  ORF Transcript_36584/g.85132 Transcript_36584/m.85132 type:complete len:107 (-) Transcript_36584:64-384(-)